MENLGSAYMNKPGKNLSFGPAAAPAHDAKESVNHHRQPVDSGDDLWTNLQAHNSLSLFNLQPYYITGTWIHVYT